jgi:hypothetical protein
MGKSRSDDEDFESRPRPRSAPRPARSGDDDLAEDNRPARPPRRRDEFDDEEDDRPRRKRSKGGTLSSVIPYRNGMALAAYYCGFGGLIFILGSLILARLSSGGREHPLWIVVLGLGLGGLFGLSAVALGILGVNHVSKNPEAKGTGHAVTGIVLGVMEIVAIIGLVVFGVATTRP